MYIYLDNSATTRVHAAAADLAAAVMKEDYGNPSSLHDAGLSAEKLLREARARVSKALGARGGDLIFTSGGTESDNMALICGARARRRQGRRIITSNIEHPAVLESCEALKDEGFEIIYADVDANGVLIPESVEAALNDDAILISCMRVNNETGGIQPLEALCGIKARFEKRAGRELLLHTDAVQSFCKLREDAPGLMEGVDLVSLSAHKIHGPKGVGAVYIRKGLSLRPLIRGGGQEQGLRSGTENAPGIAGFGLAAELASAGLPERAERAAALKERLLRGVRAEIDDIRVNGPEAEGASPFILNISFSGVKGEVLLHDLEQRGVLVSTGAACSSKRRGPSRALAAMGLSAAEAESAVRFSFGDFNTMEEIEYTVIALKEAVARFRRLGRFR